MKSTSLFTDPRKNGDDMMKEFTQKMTVVVGLLLLLTATVWGGDQKTDNVPDSSTTNSSSMDNEEEMDTSAEVREDDGLIANVQRVNVKFTHFDFFIFTVVCPIVICCIMGAITESDKSFP